LRCFLTTQDNGVQLTRRALLTAAGGLALAGCRPKRRRSPLPTAADAPAVADALAAERDLVTAYDDALAQDDAVAATALSRARARHAEHIAALTAAVRTPTASTSSTPLASTPATRIRASLRLNAGTLQAAATAVTSGATAALLASIAAEHAADAAVGADG
jgi:hypothetical protein